MRVIVVGGGVSGLSAAERSLTLARERGVACDVMVLEAGPRAGGPVGSEIIDGFVVERGADGFLNEKTSVIDLARRLGFDGRLVTTQPAKHGAFVVHRGRLEPIPMGFSMMAPTKVGPFITTPVLSLRGKVRAALELLVPRSGDADVPDRDETLASFVRRRFGNEVLERLAQPLVAGIYGGDPERLGLRATMPRFLDEERRSGSVTLGLWAKARAAEGARGARYGLFGSFDRGMQVLVDELVRAVGPERVRLDAQVTAVTPRDGRVTVAVGGEAIEADRVVMAVSSRAASPLLSGALPELSSALSQIEHGSAATVNMGFGRKVISSRHDGYGYVVPAVEERASLAATFASRKWPGRAPEGRDLVRVFLGGRWVGESDDDLVAIARRELRALLGVEDAPLFARVHRYVEAMPQYHVGHRRRVALVRELEAKVEALALAGNSLDGVGIPDAIASGQRAAERAMRSAAR